MMTLPGIASQSGTSLRNPSRRPLILAGLMVLAATADVRADEGMWTFDNLPIRQLKERYGFEPTPEWIAKVRSGAVRFNSGGSGSFVSPDGLVMTNHHIAADTLHKISTPAKDYFKDGFLARTREEEVKSPDLELNVLVGIEDVTDRINARVSKGMDDASAAKARRQATAEIEKASSERTGLRSDVVTLYRGGRYHLYTYKKYTDVRMVFAPEHAIAFFGGDPDNFEFPRYDLDVAFFRAYEDGKPARPAQYLAWGERGTKEGDLVFVAGNPGSTSRLNTVAHLEYLRDVALPRSLALLQDREAFLLEYARRGAEASRQASQDLYGVQNSRKALTGRLAGLRDPALIEAKAKAERAIRARVEADPTRNETYGSAWDKIARSFDAARRIGQPVLFVEGGAGFNSELFHIARTIDRLVEEDTKPNAERLREYGDAGRASLERAALFAGPGLSRVRGGQARALAGLLEADGRRFGSDPGTRPRRPDARRRRAQARGRLTAGRRRRPQGARQGRPGGGRGLGRPDDPAGPRHRRRRPRRARSSRTRSRASRRRSTPSSPGPRSKTRGPRPIPTRPSPCDWPSAW